MERYSIEIVEGVSLNKLQERLLRRMESEWTIILSKDEHYSSSITFDKAKDITYFVNDGKRLFYCGPINVKYEESNIVGWTFDYTYVLNEKRRVQRNLSFGPFFYDEELDDIVIKTPTIIAAINDNYSYMEKCRIYNINEIKEVFFVNTRKINDVIKEYELSIYRNTALVRRIDNVKYIKFLRDRVGCILYAKEPRIDIMIDGGVMLNYDVINNIETSEVIEGARHINDYFEKNNYIKINRNIYKHNFRGETYKKLWGLKYKKEFQLFKSLIKEFGYNEDIQESDYFVDNDCWFVKDINIVLEWLKERNKNKYPNDSEYYKFKMRANYNKAYYCVAKLSEYAINVEKRDEIYELTFDGNNLENIELMYHLVTQHGIWDARNSEEEKIIDYLIRNNSSLIVLFVLQDFVTDMNSYIYEHNISKSNHYRKILYAIINGIRKSYNQKADLLYKKMIEEKRVRIKWHNEYKLYEMLKRLVKNVEYQYHCEWLGNQSFDIFMPDYNVAIEYQGKQHYSPIDFFGGEETFRKNVERDARKRRLAKENGVIVLDWNYLEDVTIESVEKFLKMNGIVTISNIGASINVNEKENVMAPIVLPQNKKKKKNNIKSEINRYVQYSMNGELIARYSKLEDAAKNVGVSSTSIAKVVRGERHSAGGYIWRKIEKDVEPLKKIDVDFDVKKTNSGKAICVMRKNSDGEIIEEYSSLQEAARANNIKVETIKKRAKNKKDGWLLVEKV